MTTVNHPVASVTTGLSSLYDQVRLRYALWRVGRSAADTPAGRQHTPAPTAPDGTADPGGEAGMATAEYAIGTVAAAAFAGVLLTVLKSGTVKGLLTGLIQTALSM